MAETTKDRPYSQIETSKAREPPPPSKAELAWESGIRQWRKLKALRDRAREEANWGVGAAQQAEVAKQDDEYLAKYSNLLHASQQNRRLLEELRNIDDQAVARTVEEDDDFDDV
eukprot:TRINITY_DN5666_c0_g2_i1.p3 TRINITY_DN5666_c0_g2~~TRINITY_DN5666_c0_g2_i1.p3  ORF type:complete len:114 (+),score=29.01 TRINITY_DN5666_c0_g2_i1:62-403(+)